MREIIVDNFAGGGGASTGIEMATGRSVDIAINHDPRAVEMHRMNHPSTKHYCESVWDVDPIEACNGRPVGLAWFSPDCKHFSKAKGGKPVEKKIRGLAWIVLKWAALVRPRVIMLENVEEFQTWGPLIPMRDKDTGRIIKKALIDAYGEVVEEKSIAEVGETVPASRQIFIPDPTRKGRTYSKWRSQLESLGYEVDTRELIAADYGAPTKRKRFFMIARCDGKPIVWPEPTHGPKDSEEVRRGILKPYIPAASIIDWSLPCKSIFGRKKPLAENTMRRIARGLEKFVFQNPAPFLIRVNHSGADWHYCNGLDASFPTITSKNGFGIVNPYIVPIGYGEREGQLPRVNDILEPLGTAVSTGKHYVCAPTIIQYHSETTASGVRGQGIQEPIMTIDGSPRYGLVTSFLSKFCRTCVGQDMREPLHTVTTSPGHFGEVRAFLIKYYGQGTGQDIQEPLDTVVSKDRFGLVTIQGVEYQIIDIGLRMLEPHELYAAQGFPPDYITDRTPEGKKISKAERVHRCGNAVPPPFARALVKANLPELCTGRRMPNLAVHPDEKGQYQFA